MDFCDLRSAGDDRRVALITGITGQVNEILLLKFYLNLVHVLKWNKNEWLFLNYVIICKQWQFSS